MYHKVLNGIQSKGNFCADDICLFTVDQDINTSANDLNIDPEKISEYNFLWKTKFNCNPTKQFQEIIFSKKKFASSCLF